jgi:hypothetical protein
MTVPIVPGGDPGPTRSRTEVQAPTTRRRRRVVVVVVCVAAVLAGAAVAAYALSRHRAAPGPTVPIVAATSEKPRDVPAESACEAIWQTPPDLYSDAQRMVYVAANGSSSTRNPGVKAAADELGRRADDVLLKRVADPAGRLELFGAAVRFGTACTEAGYGKKS